MTRPAPPSGAPPPAEAYQSDGSPIDLVALAKQVCGRYRAEFPDEEERYGPSGFAWCLHDNQYLLAWAIQDARDSTVVLAEQVVWLARVLENRDFPVERLVRDLEIAATVLAGSEQAGALAEPAGERLRSAAESLAGGGGR